MKIQGENPETGEKFEAETDTIQSEFIQALQDFELTDEAIKKLIDSLDISADAKSLLFTFSKATIQVGGYIIKIGRKIIDYICLIYKEYPTVTFGLIFGAIAGVLVATIPIIGAVLSSVVTPILMVFGLVGGLYVDLKDKEIERKIKAINTSFSPLAAG